MSFKEPKVRTASWIKLGVEQYYPDLRLDKDSEWISKESYDFYKQQIIESIKNICERARETAQNSQGPKFNQQIGIICGMNELLRELEE